MVVAVCQHGLGECVCSTTGVARERGRNGENVGGILPSGRKDHESKAVLSR